MKNLQFENSSTSLACHPLALAAYEFTQLIFHFQNKRNISPSRLRLLNRAFRLTTLVKENQEVFIEGWISLVYGLEHSSKKQLKGSISNIEQRAWLYALYATLHLSNKNEVIYNVSLFFERAPERIQTRLFIGRPPGTVLARTIEFTSESRASVKYALKKGAENE